MSYGSEIARDLVGYSVFRDYGSSHCPHLSLQFFMPLIKCPACNRELTTGCRFGYHHIDRAFEAIQLIILIPVSGGRWPYLGVLITAGT
jgi:hypothetical protein